MVGIVIVSHSCTLAEGVVELCRMTAPNANMLAAGGMEDGGLGTSYEKIKGAVECADEGDGVLILADMGSSVMTAEMVLEDLEGVKAELADCPLVEGAVVAAISSAAGLSMEDIKDSLGKVWESRKLE